MTIEPGSNAPAFDVATDGGGSVSLAGLKGPVVLYFYPKADTPACTQEASDFTALAADFAAAGTTLIGISLWSSIRWNRHEAQLAAQ